PPQVPGPVSCRWPQSVRPPPAASPFGPLAAAPGPPFSSAPARPTRRLGRRSRSRTERCLPVQTALLPVSSANATRGQHLFDITRPVQDADDPYDRGVDSEEDPVGSHDQLPEISEPDPLQLGHDAAALREPRQRGDPRKDT